MKLITLTSANIDIAELNLLCLATDAILFRQDAVYLIKRLNLAWPTTKLYALKFDLQARNITVHAGITSITAEQWVELTIAASQNILWQHSS
jgi:sulfur relay protein TusB/DsrH